MKAIQKIEMRWPDGWYTSNELAHLVYQTNIDIRDIKSYYRSLMIFHGRYGLHYFRLRRVGGAWRYFTVER